MITNTKGYLKRTEKGSIVVGANGDGGYVGPRAQIDHDDAWLHIVTDSYEGHAMLNIEALPQLRRALTMIARERRKAAKAGVIP